MVDGNVEGSADVGLSDADKWMFKNLVDGLFARGLKPHHTLLVFVREKPYNLIYEVVATGVCRVYIFEDPANYPALSFFDFDVKRKCVYNFLPDLNTVREFLESFTIAGHW